MESSGAGTGPAAQVTTQGPAVESAGVELLIARLRDEGIAQGRSQAQALVTAAQKQAADIVAAAKREADAAAVKANEEAGKLKAVGEDAIRLAMRDTMLSLEADLTNRFQNMLQGLIRGVLEDPAFLKRLILEVAGKAAPVGGTCRVANPCRSRFAGGFTAQARGGQAGHVDALRALPGRRHAARGLELRGNRRHQGGNSSQVGG
jgi:hypothetical protein